MLVPQLSVNEWTLIIGNCLSSASSKSRLTMNRWEKTKANHKVPRTSCSRVTRILQADGNPGQRKRERKKERLRKKIINSGYGESYRCRITWIYGSCENSYDQVHTPRWYRRNDGCHPTEWTAMQSVTIASKECTRRRRLPGISARRVTWFIRVTNGCAPRVSLGCSILLRLLRWQEP